MHAVVITADSLMTAKRELPVFISYLFGATFLYQPKSYTDGNIVEAGLILNNFQHNGVLRFLNDRLKVEQFVLTKNCLAWGFFKEQIKPRICLFPNINPQLQHHFRYGCDQFKPISLRKHIYN
jgi:hypothetical protein